MDFSWWFQLIFSTYWFHMMVPLARIGEQKAALFVRQWIGCCATATKRGSFFFTLLCWFPHTVFHLMVSYACICFFLRCWFQSDGFIWVKPYVPFLWCWFSVDGSILFSCYGGIYLLMIWVRLFHALVPWDNANVEPKLKNVYCSIQNSKTKQMYTAVYEIQYTFFGGTYMVRLTSTNIIIQWCLNLQDSPH